MESSGTTEVLSILSIQTLRHSDTQTLNIKMNLIKLKTSHKYTVAVKPARTCDTKEKAERIAKQLTQQTGIEHEIHRREYCVIE